MKKGKIVITPRTFVKRGDEQVKRLENEGWEVVLNDTGQAYSYNEFVERSKDADGIILGVDIADENMMKQCKNLKTIAKYGVGVDNIDLETARELGISVSRTIGSNSNAVAEYAIALMFACSKNLVKDAMNVKNGQWNLTYEKEYSFELFDKCLGIVGFGSIGQKVAKIAQGIGMKVIVYDIFPISDKVESEFNVEVVSFDRLFEQSDVVSLHIPFTKDTENLINSKTLKKMKKNSVLINTSRGGIVNQDDLLNVLRTKSIFAAGFDVYLNEPPLDIDSLIEQDNFILTPHTASKSFESDEKTMQKSVDNILEALAINKM